MSKSTSKLPDNPERRYSLKDDSASDNSACRGVTFIIAKKCPDCGKIKPITDFGIHRGRKDGKQCYCRLCHGKRTRQWDIQHPDNHGWRTRKAIAKRGKKRNRELQRTGALKQNYKITTQQYQELEMKQDGVCAICGRKNVTFKRLLIDHDHKTGVIRGLLCHRCNVMLGFAHDKTKILKNAITYLNHSKMLETID